VDNPCQRCPKAQGTYSGGAQLAPLCGFLQVGNSQQHAWDWPTTSMVCRGGVPALLGLQSCNAGPQRRNQHMQQGTQTSVQTKALAASWQARVHCAAGGMGSQRSVEQPAQRPAVKPSIRSCLLHSEWYHAMACSWLASNSSSAHLERQVDSRHEGQVRRARHLPKHKRGLAVGISKQVVQGELQQR
jgi:hypothetical protein